MTYEVDRYALERELGRGAFGAVYLARHKVLGTNVALKLLHPAQATDANAVDRFLREARAAASIGNKHIARVSDAGIAADQQVFLAMELLDGEDLSAYLARVGRLDARDAIAIVLQVLDGLAAAHAAGIVHRDMKPANVFLTRDERGALLVKILDFGVSKMHQPTATGGNLTATGTIVGTPHYMAPEQLIESRSVDARADLYSVGVMLYEMLSGELPYNADTFGALFHEVITGAPRPLALLVPHAPPNVVAIVEHTLTKDPTQRVGSAQELASWLEHALGGVAPSQLSLPPTLASSSSPTGPITGLPWAMMRGPGPTVPMSAPSMPSMSSQQAAPKPAGRGMIAFAVLGVLALGCFVAIGALGIATRDRLSAAWSAFVGEPGAHASNDPETGGDPNVPTPIAAPPEIPMHDGTEETVGNVGISIERCSRRRADNGRWIVDMPVTIRNAGEASLVFQQSELSADGYIPTGESDLPTWSMMANGRSTSGYMVWRASSDIPDPQTITVRFRDWARRVPVTDGPRLPPRPAAPPP